jgi:hypothetical protein
MSQDTQVKSVRIVEYRKSRLMVTSGPDQGTTLALAGRQVRIGTDLDNDLVLTDPKVSRHHCSVEPTPKGLIIRDESSTNGVFIQGLRVREAVATTAPVILTVGDSELNVTPLAEIECREQLETSRLGDLVGRNSEKADGFFLYWAAISSPKAVSAGRGRGSLAMFCHFRSPLSSGRMDGKSSTRRSRSAGGNALMAASISATVLIYAALDVGISSMFAMRRMAQCRVNATIPSASGSSPISMALRRTHAES